MTTKELVIDFADLNRLLLKCPKCPTEMTFDMHRDPGTVAYPNVCSQCSSAFPVGLPVLIDGYRDAYTKLLNSRVSMQVRVPMPEQS